MTLAPMVSRPSKCAQRAPAQHAVYRWLFDHPGGRLTDASRDLHLSYSSVKVAAHRLRRRADFGRLCPECFSPSFYRLACHACGFEAPAEAPPLVDFGSQGPVHSLQPLGGLGSSTDYYSLKPKYGARNVAHLVEQSPDRFLERCRSRLWEELKGLMLSDGETEALTRLLVRDVQEFRASYPELTRSRGLADALVRRVVARAALLHPQRVVTGLQPEGGFT